MRRSTTFAALFLLTLAWAAPSRAAFARVELVPSAPAAVPPAAAGSAAAAIQAPSLSASNAALPALAPAFAAPLLAPRLQAIPELASSPALNAISGAPAAKSAPSLVPDRGAEESRPAAASTLRDAAARSEAAPAGAGRFFDAAAPAAPNFETLSPVRAPQAPARWTSGSTLLKPFAAAVNAWHAARHERRLANPLPGERVTTEEESLRETLTDLHAAVAGGRYQDAISAVADYFQTRAASSWYSENPGYRRYREQAFDYMRFAERAVLAAYGRAHARAEDPALIAEARDAARSGAILGRAWRPTAIQEKDSNFCVQNALFNAIAASVGFARPTSVADFVAASRAALNRAARIDRAADPREISALARELGVDLGRRDVDQGMGTKSMAEWASLLGMTLTPRAAPRGDAGWSALLGPGREVLLSFRMFHPRYVHSEELAAVRGHDYMVLHHEVYLLGAFDSPSRGARLYLIQDSGSGRTLMATAEELSALTQEVQVLSLMGPVGVPQSR
jgi:hypothetical protein